MQFSPLSGKTWNSLVWNFTGTFLFVESVYQNKQRCRAGFSLVFRVMGGIEFSDVWGLTINVISVQNFGEKSGFYPWFCLGRSHFLKCLGRDSFWGGIWSFLFYLGDSDFGSKMEAVWRVSARTKSKMFLGIATKVDCFKIWGYF